MDYAEASYFDGYHFQHIATYHEAARIKRITKRARELATREAPRRAVFGRKAA